MRADVAGCLSLLERVEEPGRTDVRRPRDHLHQVMHALHVDARVGGCSLHLLAERRRVVHQRALQDRRDLEALGHDVVGDELFRVRLRQCRVELRQVSRLQDPGLVGQHIQAALHRGEDAVHLDAVAAREHDDVAGTILQHALEVVVAGVDLELPRGRPFGAPVEARDPIQVLEQVRAERREDMDALRDARIHLLLHQPGVEVPGIDGHQPDVTRLKCVHRSPGGGHRRRADQRQTPPS